MQSVRDTTSLSTLTQAVRAISLISVENNDNNKSEIATAYGAALKAKRIANGWTQKELAQRVGKHQATIAKIEAGIQETSLTDAELIARALGATLSDMVGHDIVWLDALQRHWEVLTELQAILDTLTIIADARKKYVAAYGELEMYIHDHPERKDIEELLTTFCRVTKGQDFGIFENLPGIEYTNAKD